MVADELNDLAGRIGRAVRAARAARSMSLGDLARAAGLSKTILARIETGSGNPSLETLWRLHRALHVPLGALLADAGEPRVRVVRAGTGEPLHAESGMTARLVHADGSPHRSEVYELALPRGVEQRSEPHLPGTRELITCLSGRVRTGPASGPVELARGDSVWFAADVAHVYQGVRDARAQCLMLYGAG